MAKLSKNRCRYSFCPYFFYRNSNSTSLIERLRTKESKPETPFSEKHFGRCGIFPEILLLLCATKTPIIMSFIDVRGRFLIGAYSCKRGSALGLSKTFVCRGTNGDAPRRAGRGRYPGCGFASEGYPQTFYLLKFHPL